MNIKQLESFSPAHWQYDLRDQLRRHVFDRSSSAFRAGDAARDAIRTVAGLRSRQRLIRRTFFGCIGDLPKGGPLNVRSVGIVSGPGFRVEKLIFESRPKHFVTANLYLPEGLKARTGAILLLCGHDKQAKQNYAEICQLWVRAGLAVLVQDPIGQGERFSYYDPQTRRQEVRWGTLEHDHAGAQCVLLGQTIGRYFLHDAMRGVDYLLTRREVDPRRIGVTGGSGGGLQSAMMMMADPRIAAAAPAVFLTNRESWMWTGHAQDAEQIWPGFTAQGLDHEDILLGMCAKPVRVLAAKWDFFPIEGTRRTVERCRRFWKMCGKPGALDLVEDANTHGYTCGLAQAAMEFFSRHLLGRKPGRSRRWVAFPDPSRLRCTRSGQVRGELAGARFVHEANQMELRAIRRPRHPAEGLKWLRRLVLANRRVCDLNPRFLLNDWAAGNLAVEQAWWWSQAGIINTGLVFREASRRGKKLPVTVALWDGGCTRLRPHWAWIHAQCRRGRAVFVVEPTGTGSISASPMNAYPLQEFYGSIHTLTDDLLWLGDSLAALRTWDVLRALDVAELWPNLDSRRLHGLACGRHGIYLQLAAALDRRIRRLEVHEGIGSFAKLVKTRLYDSFDVKSLLLPGVLRHFDLPDLRKTMKGAL
jgi:acetyl esterase/lipase